jgi:release factor glutamine methyltransferase
MSFSARSLKGVATYQAKDWLAYATERLEAAGVPTARLDALILLEDALGHDRAYMLAHPEVTLAKTTHELLETQLIRRAGHEPLAYVRGKSEFYGRTFKVNRATLQPRPETETMIEHFLNLPLAAGSIIADIGTGSGAIAISAKLEEPSLQVHATEIQPQALTVARTNAALFGADVSFHEGDLLQPVTNLQLAVILANLPYVPDSHTINQAAMQEPAIAIFGGPDGLDPYRKLFAQAKLLPHLPRYILTESLPFQHASLRQIANDSGYRLIETADFIQVFEA